MIVTFTNKVDPGKTRIDNRSNTTMITLHAMVGGKKYRLDYITFPRIRIDDMTSRELWEITSRLKPLSNRLIKEKLLRWISGNIICCVNVIDSDVYLSSRGVVKIKRTYKIDLTGQEFAAFMWMPNVGGDAKDIYGKIRWKNLI